MSNQWSFCNIEVSQVSKPFTSKVIFKLTAVRRLKIVLDELQIQSDLHWLRTFSPKGQAWTNHRDKIGLINRFTIVDKAHLNPTLRSTKMISIDAPRKHVPKRQLSPKKRAQMISTACNSGKSGRIASAIGEALRDNGMTKMSAKTGIGRAVLYRSFGEKGNPTLQILCDALKALKLKIQVVPMDTPTNDLFADVEDDVKDAEVSKK